MLQRSLLAATMLSLTVPPLAAQDGVYTGSGFTINAAGTTASVLTVPENTWPLPPKVVRLTFGTGPGGYHSWAGDLVVTLSHAGRTLTLFDRIGRSVPASRGDDSDLSGTYTFALDSQRAGAMRLIDAASLVGPTGIVDPNQHYLPTNNLLNGSFGPEFSGEQPSPPDFFAGLPTGGNWTLTITDAEDGDRGTLISWQLEFSAVPEPSGLGLGAVSLAAILLYKRSRQERRAARKKA